MHILDLKCSTDKYDFSFLESIVIRTTEVINTLRYNDFFQISLCLSIGLIIL
jgi:hypothetical protein